MPNYTLIYRKKDNHSGSLLKSPTTLPNIKSLARYLNNFVKAKPEYHVIAVFLMNDKGDFVSNVRFLQSEFASQRWLTGYNERVLANAIEVYGMDLKWNSGLKQVALEVVK